MSNPTVSPKYILDLIEQVEPAIWKAFPTSKYKNVENYMKRWQNGKEDDFGNIYDGNFDIYYKDNQHIDLDKTMHNMPDEYILGIATELGIETPGFLPIMPQKFKNILKDNNRTAYQNFERAIKNTYENPDESVLLATTVLDSLIKTILNNDKIKDKIDFKIRKNGSLTEQANAIIKVFKKESSSSDCPKEIFTLTNNLSTLCKTLDDLRSDKTPAHGSLEEDYIVNDPLWAILVINTTVTLGIFIWDFFNKKYNIEKEISQSEIDIENIPF